VACPKGISTGGPEALNQLVKSLRDHGESAVLWDPDPVRRSVKPSSRYEMYGNTWLDSEPEAMDVIVLPEVMSELIPKFYKTNLCIFWWLSVDNYLESEPIPVEILRQYFPDLIHAYQSEYARSFLESNFFRSSIPLSDYINVEYYSSPQTSVKVLTNSHRRTLIAINPAKGFERTELLLQRISAKSAIRLENMTSEEVIQALRSSMFYIDLGHHPGKDRFPREAASQGCIVLTNIRGAAGNEIDVPIDPDRFKFDDQESDFVEKIENRLSELLFDVETELENQLDYRLKILNEKQIFDDEVLNLIELVKKFSENSSPKPINEIEQVSSYLHALFGKRDSLAIERDSLAIERDSLAIERDSLAIERDSLAIRIKELANSFSWRITRPIRVIHRMLSSH
jgi:hypothetical protein